jgi:AraC-like DNA-binding protein
MQLVKRMRLEECRRYLEDSAYATTPIKDLIAVHGYVRTDQFARDFKQLYGVSASEVRRLRAYQDRSEG